MAHWGTTFLSGTHAQKRSEVRMPVKHAAILHYKGTQIPVVLHDLSRGGARVAVQVGRTGMTLDGPNAGGTWRTAFSGERSLAKQHCFRRVV